MAAEPPPPPPTRRRSPFTWVWRLALALVAVIAGLLVMAQIRMEEKGTVAALDPASNVFLIVGTDNRENLPEELGGFFGDFPGERADVMILAQVVGGRRQLLSIPRDLKVEIPGEGAEKINAALPLGGPNLLAETVAIATGIRAGHYVELEFAGFAAIIDALGGIELVLPFPARDQQSGLAVEAGTVTVDGATALAYARSRNYEEFRDGEWVFANQGDIARTGRQREVLLAILAKASSGSGLIRSPLLINAVGSHLATDSRTHVLSLAALAVALQTASVTDSATLPVRDLTEDGIAYVTRDEPAATAMVEAFAAGQPLPQR